MPHPLEQKYGLTAEELLDAIDKRFRLKVALEGAVAEVHFERKLRIASKEGWLPVLLPNLFSSLPIFSFTQFLNPLESGVSGEGSPREE